MSSEDLSVKEPTATAQQELLGKRVINTMVGVVTKNAMVLCHKLYFDRFFCSYKLMYDLAKNSFVFSSKNTRKQKGKTETFWI